MMKIFFRIIVALGFLSFASLSFSATCPSLETSSLAWGEVPAPWEVSPFSNKPQAEEGAEFVRANILIAGLPRGVACTYKNSLGEYTIWWQTPVKRPSRLEIHWHEVYGGYACTSSIEQCVFYP